MSPEVWLTLIHTHHKTDADLAEMLVDELAIPHTHFRDLETVLSLITAIRLDQLAKLREGEP